MTGCTDRGTGCLQDGCRTSVTNRSSGPGRANTVQVSCRVLGAVEVVREGAVVSSGGAQPRLVLALLIADRGRVVPVDRLVDALWGPSPPATAVPVVQTLVSRLRRVLADLPDPPHLETRPPGYLLDLDAQDLDAGRFEAGLYRARKLLGRDPHEAVTSVRDALAEWHGPAFAEFAGVEHLRVEVDRLEDLRVAAHELLLGARLACGEHEEVIASLDHLVAEHPLRERLWAQLMIALYRSGRPGEALQRSEQLRRLLREELGLSPSSELRELEQDILAERPHLRWAGGGGAGTTPPIQPGTGPVGLVGRGAELAALRGLLATRRLVSVTGPGGVGKTRLAAELLAEHSAVAPDGGRWVDLAPVRGPAAALAAVAGALDLQRRAERSIEDSIIDVLTDRVLVLALDNCEHVLDVITPLVTLILRRCPGVGVLATTREPLGLPGETTWVLSPLAVPSSASATVEEVRGSAAGALFTTRAQAARPGFVLGAGNRRAVAEICIRLDGLPLALELAAARVRSMTPEDLAERLDARFRLLASPHSPDTRHRALLDVMQWSHDLLTPSERLLFARLSVFAGRFDLPRAEDVCASDGLERAEVAALLAALVDKSMVVAEPAGDRMRYRLLATLRAFARERLDERPDAGATRRAHALSHLQGARAAGAGTGGPDEGAWLHRIGQDVDDLREAFETSARLGDVDTALELVTSMREYAFRGIHDEVLDWAQRAVDLPGSAGNPLHPLVLAMIGYGRFVRGELADAVTTGRRAVEAAAALGVSTGAVAERVLANALIYQGRTQQAMHWMDRMVAAARETADDAVIAHSCYMSSVARTSTGDRGTARRLADEAGRAADRCGSPTALAQAAYAWGLHLEGEDPDRALDLLVHSGQTALAAGNRWLHAFARTEELYLRAQRGDAATALRGYRDVVQTWYRGGDWANQWLSLRHLMGVFAALGDDDVAAVLHGALDAAGATAALPFELSGAERVTALLAAARARLGATAFDLATDRGRRMRDEEVVRLTLTHLDMVTRDPGSPGS